MEENKKQVRVRIIQIDIGFCPPTGPMTRRVATLTLEGEGKLHANQIRKIITDLVNSQIDTLSDTELYEAINGQEA